MMLIVDPPEENKIYSFITSDGMMIFILIDSVALMK